MVYNVLYNYNAMPQCRGKEMPRVVPYVKKERWFEEFGTGESVAKIANRDKKDPRTVQRGIEEVRNRRLTAQVREEILKEGLRKHQDLLLNTLSTAAGSIAPISIHVEKLYFPKPSVPDLQVELNVVSSDDGYVDVALDVEQGFAWQLLLQHLGKTKPFRYLSVWKSALVEELNARLALRGLVKEGATKKAGLTISESPDKPNAIRPEALYELAKGVFSIALQEHPMYAMDIRVDKDGVMRVNDGGKSRRGQDEERANALRQIMKSLACGETAQSLQRHHAKTDVAARRARQAFLEVAMSYYIPGHCASCARYSP